MDRLPEKRRKSLAERGLMTLNGAAVGGDEYVIAQFSRLRGDLGGELGIALHPSVERDVRICSVLDQLTYPGSPGIVPPLEGLGRHYPHCVIRGDADGDQQLGKECRSFDHDVPRQVFEVIEDLRPFFSSEPKHIGDLDVDALGESLLHREGGDLLKGGAKLGCHRSRMSVERIITAIQSRGARVSKPTSNSALTRAW